MKKSYLGSVLAYKCPKCREGNLFKKNNFFRISQLSDTHEKCPHCGEDFQKEPGFYFGAAYVSYALTVALWVAVYVALITFDAIGLIQYDFFENPWVFLISGVVTLIVLLPVVYRLSRSLWISFFVKYDKNL